MWMTEQRRRLLGRSYSCGGLEEQSQWKVVEEKRKESSNRERLKERKEEGKKKNSKGEE